MSWHQWGNPWRKWVSSCIFQQFEIPTNMLLLGKPLFYSSAFLEKIPQMSWLNSVDIQSFCYLIFWERQIKDTGKPCQGYLVFTQCCQNHFLFVSVVLLQTSKPRILFLFSPWHGLGNEGKIKINLHSSKVQFSEILYQWMETIAFSIVLY